MKPLQNTFKSPQKKTKYSIFPFTKKRRAFTLVELMIAMAIIAILATAGIQAYTGYVKKGRDTARAEIAGDLNTAVTSYAASNNGLPPADASAFDDFLQGAGSTFGVSSSLSSSGILVEDPVGGKEVCLDAEGNPNQPCVFNYTAYEDGTYTISYGVEHETSTEKNFYKTEQSIPTVTETSTVLAEQQVVPKYGVYTGSAKYIGKPATVDNSATGVDVVQSVTPTYRSLMLNVVDSGGQYGSGRDGDECFSHQQCGQGLYCQRPNSWPDESCYLGECTYQVISNMSMPQCAAGNRNLGTGSSCSSDSQCSSGYCMGSLCVQPQALNTSCASHTQCLYKMQHFCINSVCTYYNN